MAALIPVDAPSLAPLQESFEYDQLEAELKAAFLAVFESMLRASERRLNLYGMPHLGDSELIERAMKDAGLSIIRRNTTRTSFLLKAAKARNPRRGMLFLRQYLQSVWPNVWKVEPLWHPLATAGNYPNELTPLGTKDLGNGFTAEYDPDSETGIPTLYRTDWQGKQQLYAAPRTNDLLQSANLAAAPWQQNIGGAWVSAASTEAVGPDGSADNVTKFTATATPAALFTRQGGLTLAAGARAASVWVYVPSAQGVANFAFQADWQDANTGASNSYTEFDKWIRVSSAGTLTDVRTWVDFNIKPNGATPAAGFYFFAAFAQDEPGPTTTRHIATTVAPVTVTDYTTDAEGVATFAGGVPAPAPLTHFRTGRIRITLPVTIDNGLGLVEIAKAFRSTLAPRLMLELRLATVMDNTLAVANGIKATMPFMGIGTLTR